MSGLLGEDEHDSGTACGRDALDVDEGADAGCALGHDREAHVLALSLGDERIIDADAVVGTLRSASFSMRMSTFSA